MEVVWAQRADVCFLGHTKTGGLWVKNTGSLCSPKTYRDKQQLVFILKSALAKLELCRWDVPAAALARVPGSVATEFSSAGDEL